MNRGHVALIVAGIVIGYLAHEPSAPALLGIVLVAGLGFVVVRASRPPVAVEGGQRELDHMTYELGRARRFERMLSLVVVRPADGDIQATMQGSVIQAVGTRHIDRAWLEDGTLFLLLPETNPEGAAVVIRRIESAFASQSIRAASAVFPIDAVTSEALIQAAVSGLRDVEPVHPIRTADSVS